MHISNSPKASQRWHLLAGLLALATAAHAQAPAMLLGQWEMCKVSFVASQPVSPEMLAQLDNPEAASLNQEVAAGTAHLVVAFRPDGTYLFRVARPDHPVRTEAGTYFVKDGTLFAQSPATEGGSSFNGQRIVQLSRRKLVVEFAIGPEMPGVVEEIDYQRVRAQP